MDALQIPPDLEQALDRSPAAGSFFRDAAPSYRRNVLRRLHAARKPATRAARIERIVSVSASGQRVPQM